MNDGQVNTVQATPMMLVQMAMEKGLDIEKLERLIAFQERSQAETARLAFNDALTACQSQIGRVATDSKNKQTNSEYASYAALDRAIRPVYTEYGFSLSFNTGVSTDTSIEVHCDVSHIGGHTKRYSIPMPCDGKGAKGGEVMTRTHAMGSAMSYGMRYLLKMIFNVAIGQDDDDGNGAATSEIKRRFDECKSVDELKTTYLELFSWARSLKDNGAMMRCVVDCNDARKKELSNAAV